MACLVCHETSQTTLSPVFDPQTLEEFSIRFCQQCGTGQTWPQPSDLNPYYSAYYGSRHGFSERLCLRRRLAWLKAMSGDQKGKLLDFGCGDGSFLKAAAQAGWQVAGVELEPQRARAAGFEVGREPQELQVSAPFDCITLWHSLEHLPAPADTLQQLKALLAPQGLLLLAVPNAHGWQSRFFGSKWLHYDVPRHLYHFGPDSICRLLQAQHFEPLRWWHQEFEYDLLGWSQSALNSLLVTPNIFFKLLTGRPSGVSRALQGLNWLGGFIFSALVLPLLPLSAYFKAGGTVVVAARLK